jgi:hypothetical protein
VQHLVLAAYEHRHSLQEVDDVHTTNVPLLQSKLIEQRVSELCWQSCSWNDVPF